MSQHIAMCVLQFPIQIVQTNRVEFFLFRLYLLTSFEIRIIIWDFCVQRKTNSLILKYVPKYGTWYIQPMEFI